MTLLRALVSRFSALLGDVYYIMKELFRRTRRTHTR